MKRDKLFFMDLKLMSASAFTAVFGAVSGIGCAAFANGLRKLPPFSRA